MNPELEFPPIDTAALAAPAAPVALAEPATGTVQLAKIDLQAVALASFETARTDSQKAKGTLAGVVHDLSTSTKLAEAKSLRQRLINAPLAEARKVSTTLKAKLTAVSKAVGAELAAIEAEFAEADKLITPQIDAREAELAEERRIAAEKESARVKVHTDNIAKLADYAERARGLSAERIRNGIAIVAAIEIDRAAWEEFADRAEEQKAVTLERMHKELATSEALEAEALRLANERAELERQRAELEREREQLQAAAAQKAAEETCTGADQAKAEAVAVIEAAQAKAPPPADAKNAAMRAVMESLPFAAGAVETYALKLGTICERLGFTVSAEFLAGLGFEHHPERGAKLYRESDWPLICDALIQHLKDVRAPLAVGN